MTEYTHDELSHERDMQDEGANRYRFAALRARERENLTILPSGRALVRESITGVEAYIREYCKDRGKRGETYPEVALLRLIDPQIAALLALTVVVDGLHRARLASSLANFIGRTCEDEYRFKVLSKEEPGIWKKIRQDTTRSGPTHRRRVAVARGNRAGVLPDRWTPRGKMRVGLTLIEAVSASTGILEVRVVRRSRTKSYTMVTPSDKAIVWLEEADEHAAMIQPLYLPTLDLPIPWVGVEGGGYLTDLVVRRPIARFHGKAHRRLLDTTPPENYRTVTSALNRLQRVRWRVDEDLLVTLEHLLEQESGPLEHLADAPLPVKPPDIVDNDEARATWRRSAGRVRAGNFRRRSSRILASRTIGVARRMHNLGRAFSFPHRLDFRSRAYPQPVWLQAQGPDIARSLLRFADPEPMTARGWGHLMAYGAALHGDGGDEAVAELVGRDPLQHADLWVGTKSPCQFLAWCLEVNRALEAGWPRKPFLTSLPVVLDASNNGLQLYALLTGDRDLARRTNCLPGPKQDLYVEVAGLVGSIIEEDARLGHPEAIKWVDALGDDGIPRECAKRPVMTKSYAVTLWSAADYVFEWYQETYDPKHETGGPIKKPGRACRYLAGLMMGVVDHLCEGATQGMAWLQSLARECSERGVPLRWTTPLGWPVLQEYRSVKRTRVKALLGGAVRRVQLIQHTGKTDPRRQRLGSAPNYIHSIDASIMAWAVSRTEGAIMAVHDGFGQLAPRIDNLNPILRASMVEITLNKDPFSVTKREVEDYIGRGLTDAPRLGIIEPEEVMSAEHLFGF